MPRCNTCKWYRLNPLAENPGGQYHSTGHCVGKPTPQYIEVWNRIESCDIYENKDGEGE
jgi:hypothetical protein